MKTGLIAKWIVDGIVEGSLLCLTTNSNAHIL